MGLWFAAIGSSGLAQVIRDPGILRAASPAYAAEFALDHAGVAIHRAGIGRPDGDRGRGSVRRHGALRPRADPAGGFAIVVPSLALNYMGQGALILSSPAAIENPFFLLVPHWSRVPMVLLATAATVIASQAVISGTLSLKHQATRLGSCRT